LRSTEDQIKIAIIEEESIIPSLHSGPSSIDRVANQKLLFAIILAIFTRLAATLTHYGHN